MRSRRTRRRLRGFLFITPALAFVCVFFVYPLAMTIWMSLHDWPLLGEAEFIGLENYSNAFGDEQWRDSLWFTAKYTLVLSPLIFLVGWMLAVAIKDPRPGIGVFRTAFFLPVVVGFGASSLLWVAMLNGRVGIFNRILTDLSITDEPTLWFREHNTALAAVVISIAWKTVGLTMILLMAGLQSIPRDLNEAASIDGAGRLQRFRYVTFPLVRPTFALALILSVTGSILAFDQFFIMTRGGPRNSTITAVYWIYNRSFISFDLGYGAALAIQLLFALIGLTVVQLVLLRTEDDAAS